MLTHGRLMWPKLCEHCQCRDHRAANLSCKYEVAALAQELSIHLPHWVDGFTLWKMTQIERRANNRDPYLAVFCACQVYVFLYNETLGHSRNLDASVALNCFKKVGLVSDEFEEASQQTCSTVTLHVCPSSETLHIPKGDAQ